MPQADSKNLKGSLSSYYEQIIRALSEGGISTLIRRSLYVALDHAGESLKDRAQRLFYTDASKVLTKKERQLLTRNKQFHNCHRGRRAFVIGNGPSLNSHDLYPLRGDVTFALNRFWSHPVLERSDWQPSYYFLVNDHALYRPLESTDNFYRDLRERVQRSVFFANLKFHELIEKRQWLPSQHTYYVAVGGHLPNAKYYNHVDLSQVVPSAKTVLITALLSAIYMGCNPIYILGADHDWLREFGGYEHFYEGPTLDHLKKDENRLLKSYKTMLEYVLDVWSCHERISAIADRQGIQIYNATPGGCLDVYPRRDYDAII